MPKPGTLYLPSYTNLRRHPKVRRLAKALDVSIPTAIGHLHCLWWYAVESAQDGDLSRVTVEDIALAAEWDEDADTFLAAMQRAGFMDDLRIHDWDDYAGAFLSKRERDRENALIRQHRHRAKAQPVTRESRVSHGLSRDVTRMSRPVTDNKEEIREEEKKREEINTTPVPISLSNVSTEEPNTDFNEWWSQYPRKENKKKAAEVWRTLSDEDRAAAIDRLPLFLPRYLSDDPQFTPLPTTWLNGRRWEDQPLPPKSSRVTNGRVDFLAKAEESEHIIEGSWR